VIDANLLAPIVKESDPVAKRSDFRYFTWHSFKPLTTKETKCTKVFQANELPS
jgi:hypothetical protein